MIRHPARILMVGAVLALAGCQAVAGGTPIAVGTGNPSATRAASPAATDPGTTPTYFPLTGLAVPDGATAHPAIMAKIDNHVDARPQAGLNHADIVFEELVEGGITRYLVVWHSTIPNLFGPVRSIRPMDPDIASAFGGIITYSGGQYRFVQMMQHTRVKNVIDGMYGSGPYIFRSSSRPAPHNVIVRGTKLVASNASLKPPAKAFTFAQGDAVPTAVESGKPRAHLVAMFATGDAPSWRFDATSGSYLRFQASGAKDIDEHSKQLSAANVIVQMTRETYEFGYVPHAQVVGSGVAWISTGGSTIKATWTKKLRNSRTAYTLADGTTVTLAPGRTWIELVPTTGKFTATKG